MKNTSEAKAREESMPLQTVVPLFKVDRRHRWVFTPITVGLNIRARQMRAVDEEVDRTDGYQSPDRAANKAAEAWWGHLFQATATWRSVMECNEVHLHLQFFLHLHLCYTSTPLLLLGAHIVLYLLHYIYVISYVTSYTLHQSWSSLFWNEGI